MKMIRVPMPEDVYERLKQRAKDDGYVGIASLLLSAVGENNKQSEAATVANKAINRAIRKKKKGETFLVKDLVSDWEDLDSGIRIRVGKYFYERVLTEDLDVKPLKKGSSGHQIYQKIK